MSDLHRRNVLYATHGKTLLTPSGSTGSGSSWQQCQTQIDVSMLHGITNNESKLPINFFATRFTAHGFRLKSPTTAANLAGAALGANMGHLLIQMDSCLDAALQRSTRSPIPAD